MIPAVMPAYTPFDVAIERGEGVYLFDTEGRRYLDFGTGVAVCALGHCHPRMVQALTEQAGKVWHTSNNYIIPGQERLAKRLVKNTFAASVLFNQSGAEAVECGLKIVRKYHDQTGNPGRYRVITFAGAFHGRTLATIAAAAQEKLLKGFDPIVDGFDQVPFGDLDAVKAAITPETGAILVEPVQGEGGIHAGSLEFLRGLRAMADEHGLLLFFDEVQSGMGRTGKLFAYEWTGIEPDILAAGKGLGAGFPVGACLVNERSMVITPGSHGSTLGGNPLAMAVSNAVLDVLLGDGFFDHVNAIAGELRTGLAALVEAHPAIFQEVRGSGLLLGLKCTVENLTAIKALLGNGLLAIRAGDNVMRLLPPLIIEGQHVDEALEILERTCGELEQAA